MMNDELIDFQNKKHFDERNRKLLLAALEDQWRPE
jgi:hypothetical protein